MISCNSFQCDLSDFSWQLGTQQGMIARYRTSWCTTWLSRMYYICYFFATTTLGLSSLYAWSGVTAKDVVLFGLRARRLVQVTGIRLQNKSLTGKQTFLRKTSKIHSPIQLWKKRLTKRLEFSFQVLRELRDQGRTVKNCGKNSNKLKFATGSGLDYWTPKSIVANYTVNQQSRSPDFPSREDHAP